MKPDRRPIRQLDGRTPAAAVDSGNAEAVHRIIDRMDDGELL